MIGHEDIQKMLADRTRLLEDTFLIAQALGFQPYRSKGEDDGEFEYHLPCAADMVEAIKKMTTKDVMCVSVPDTPDCTRAAPKDTAFEKGWRTVAMEWWCPSCMERYGFVPDTNPP